MTQPEQRATRALRAATTPHGILASTRETDNYRRVWCRDGIIAGLAGLLRGDETVTRGLRATLRTLARAQGPNGEIPSNVLLDDGEIVDVSYGSTCGRVDTPAWFVLGLVQYVETTGFPALGSELESNARDALDAYRRWELNDRGLVYVPQGGDWADEYILRGYVLNVQLLRLWALQAFAEATDDGRRLDRAGGLRRRLERNFWPSRDRDPDDAYHPVAVRRFLEEHDDAEYWLPSLDPGGYSTVFDGWSNALALLLELGSNRRRASVRDRAEAIRRERPRSLLPAFWPPVEQGDDGWDELQTNRRGSFENAPGRYHNGGLWPIVNAFWGMALVAEDEERAARDVLAAIRDANSVGPSPFPEYLDANDGSAGGTAPCTWSAAAPVLLECALDGDPLSFTTPPH